MINVSPLSAELVSNVSFYRLYDDLFFFNKAKVLNYMSHSNFYEIYENAENLEEIEKWRRNLRVEVHFTCIHNIEVMIELIASLYKSLPTSIYLINYKNTLKKAENIIRGDLYAITGIKGVSSESFIGDSIFSGFSSDRTEFTEAVEHTHKILVFLCQHYLRYLDSYNSYKHGLRISQGERSFEVALEEDNPQFQALIKSDTLSYWTKPKTLGGEQYYDSEICNYDSDFSMYLIMLMHKIVNTIKLSRLSHLQNEAFPGAKLITRSDGDELQSRLAEAKLGILRFAAPRP
jgi:hypothetical protein